MPLPKHQPTHHIIFKCVGCPRKLIKTNQMPLFEILNSDWYQLKKLKLRRRTAFEAMKFLTYTFAYTEAHSF